MDLGLTGRVAVVTGGARGIGRAIAEAFAAEGARVALIDLDPATPEIARQLGGSGRSADVSDEAAVARAFDAIDEELGPVDHLIHAAAVGSGKIGFPFWELAPPTGTAC